MVSRRSAFSLSKFANGLVDLQAQVNQRSARVTQREVHFLNRISWGATPDDIREIADMGIEAYLERQLNPDLIDDSEVEERLTRLPLLEMDRKEIHRVSNPFSRFPRTLIAAKIERALYGKRYLFERMVDFWTDHFNIAILDDGENAGDIILFQREAIRKHALGKFSQLLNATAKAPAMLYYLDNYVNVKGKPNENYAREIMELHTLGVDGGYTEADVVEVARAFTGWTIHDGSDSGFFFSEEDHDMRPKTVLGRQLPEGRGIEDGLAVLNILSNHPETARFLSFKLCRRFVSDNPPQSLVDSTTQVWEESRGDIKTVLRHILLSDEFTESVGQKLRRPFEFVMAAMRVTGTRFKNEEELGEMIRTSGQLPYYWLPPDGYPDESAKWLNTGALLVRWNISARLTHEAYSTEFGGETMSTDLHKRIGNPQTAGELVDAVSRQVLGVPLVGLRRDELLYYISGNTAEDTPVSYQMRATKLASLYQLLLASPEFQWT